MILATIFIFNHYVIKECETLQEALDQVDEWKKKFEFSYPHGDFPAKIYEANKILEI